MAKPITVLGFMPRHAQLTMIESLQSIGGRSPIDPVALKREGFP
jgi:hypothetical protein